ncbi:MAG: hypothetical protein V4544_07125 [Pseudomonadota bacterium]
MLRRPTFWFVTLAICVGMVLFRIKYEVIALEQHNTRLKKEIHENKDAIHHLKAEWTYLNDPKRLQASSKNHLNELNPVKSGQLITFQDMAGSNTNIKPESSQKKEAQSTLDAYVADFALEASEEVHA